MARSDPAEQDRTDRATTPCGLAEGLHVRRWIDFDLPSLSDAWIELARRAVTPNPFFEAWFLIPSLRNFDPDGKVFLALLVEGGVLCGLAPCAEASFYHGRRLPHFTSWLHANAFCGNPLVLPDHEVRFWRVLLEFCDGRSGRGLFLHLPQMPVDCPVTTGLKSACEIEYRVCRTVHLGKRALLKHGLTPTAHLDVAMSAKKRKELRRQRARLAERGNLAFVRQRGDCGLAAWIDRFLALERSGWKGQANSALACDPRNAAFLREALEGAARLGHLERLSLELDGHPLAMLATFLSPPGSFAFKTAYDENFARYSPGLLLQLENLALLEDPTLAWCDSCAAADHPMIERIWRDTRDIASYSVAIGGPIRRAIGGTLATIEARRAKSRR